MCALPVYALPGSPTRLPSPTLTDHNPIRMQSWYVRERDPLAGLLTDFRFRHTPEDYPRPSQPCIAALKRIFVFVPLISVVTAWSWFTPM